MNMAQRRSSSQVTQNMVSQVQRTKKVRKTRKVKRKLVKRKPVDWDQLLKDQVDLNE